MLIGLILIGLMPKNTYISMPIGLMLIGVMLENTSISMLNGLVLKKSPMTLCFFALQWWDPTECQPNGGPPKKNHFFTPPPSLIPPSSYKTPFPQMVIGGQPPANPCRRSSGTSNLHANYSPSLIFAILSNDDNPPSCSVPV